MSEFNRSPREAGEVREYKSPPKEQFSPDAEYHSAKEAQDAPEQRAKQPAKKKEPGLSHLVPAFVLAAVAAVAVVSVGTAEEGSATIKNARATDTTIACEVEATGENLQLVLYNDFIRLAEPIEAGGGAEEFTGLKPSMEYTLAVVGEGAFGETTLTEMTVSTNALPEPVSEIYGVEHKCTCSVDGYFHFTIDFIDEAGVFSDFSASLTDAYGNVSECAFTENVHADQHICVTVGANLLGKTADLLITCKRAGEELVICHETVKI